jgi:hypothetical protein
MLSVAWFTRRCPIRDEERIWIDESMAWFVDVFGSGPLASPVTAMASRSPTW